MKNKVIIYAVIITFLNYLGCTTKEVMTKNTFIETYVLNNKVNDKDIYINTIDDNKYFFSAGMYFLENDSLAGTGRKITLTESEIFKGKIALSDIASVEQETTDSGNTILLVTGILVVGAITLAGIAALSVSSSIQSCNSSRTKY